MKFKELLKQKIKAQEDLLNLAIAENRAMTAEEQTKFDGLETEITNLKKTIEAQEKLSAREKDLEKPVNTPIPAEPNSNQPLREFKNFADQLKAIKKFSESGTLDDRLHKLMNASGMNEGIGSEGGFPVQTDFAGAMMDSAAKAGQILPLVDKYEISGNANSVKWIDIDESSVATTVFGGVQVYWAAEAATVTAKKPVLSEKELDLHKLMGIAYATYELEQDSNFVSQLYQKAFSLAIQRELESCVISGNGVGKPLGFLNGGDKVQVSKETGQAANTVLYENIVKMYNRAKDKQKGVWLLNPDVQEQLDFMSFPVGVGGVPIYLQASSVGTLASLKGKPIIESDQCSALSSVGDINFVDLSDYLMIYKGGVQQDTSIHVQFLYAENCFRFIFRANGMPKKSTTLTIKNSSNARSSFVYLQAR
jgi:HK97 family phage major capsid protein